MATKSSVAAVVRGDQPPPVSLFGDDLIDDDLLMTDQQADPLIYTLRRRPVGSNVDAALYATEYRGSTERDSYS